MSASIICDERCGERRVLLGEVTKFHERVSPPLRPAAAAAAFVGECNEERKSGVRPCAREAKRDRNVLGSALLARTRVRERERERGAKGRPERTRAEDGEKKTSPRARGKKTEAARSEKNTERPDPLSPARFLRNRASCRFRGSAKHRRPERVGKREEEEEYVRGIGEKRERNK